MSIERYRRAVSATRLTPDSATLEVVAAAGMVGRADNEQARAGIALHRLYAGDSRAAGDAVAQLAANAWSRAQRERVRLKRQDARDLAAIVLQWRGSVCGVCHGHGYMPVGGAIGSQRCAIGDEPCPACSGAGRPPLRLARRHPEAVAQWIVDQIEQALGAAAGELRKKLR